MRVKSIVTALFGLTLANAKLIMLIRHGEKIDDEHTDLSPQGQARADCLNEVFGSNGYLTTPQKIYAQRPTEQRKSTRPKDTVTPLANSLGLQVDLSFTSGKYKDLAKTIYSSPEEVILVCWGNDRIPNIANELGIDSAPEWKGKVFDDVWILTDNMTPYTNSNIQPYRIFYGDKGLDMYVVKEYIDQCISNRLATNVVNKNDNASIIQEPNNSGSEMIKINAMAVAAVLSTFLYLLF
ncbi:hypothetical protein BCR36DRAFT_586398 [Piromyces finnis]|uniref:Phosphoglycerate mutase family protein n=1 Tax=Piromyces finnis TaxID=1754191 RepID=A0A1Y1UZ75_9FUNG|nr:hypothetical protein BCR36DRAFT_586398 [Piromyces finnis]|eukprot:ORX43933.1 hypothetical protein BCR36DRAFT_586398 [Piromyces finnis]